MRPLSTALLLLLTSCATVPPATQALGAQPGQAPLEALPLPDDLTSCVRHSDCWLPEEPLRVVRNDDDCLRPAPPQFAVNVARSRPLLDAAARCTSRFQPPRAYRPEPRTVHAICLQHACAVRPGGGLTRDEEAEERRGEGSPTAEGPGCYQDSDCPIEGRYTQFPDGATDVHGDEWCPVCERPGERLPDEGARVSRLLSATRTVSTLKVDRTEGPIEPLPQSIAVCPALTCRQRVSVCLRRVCSTEVPPRTPRAPLAVSRFAIAAEPEAPPPPPDLVSLPAGPAVTCTSSRDCVMSTVACSCGAEEPLNRRAASDRARLPLLPCNRPCAHLEGQAVITIKGKGGVPPALSPQTATCFQSVCVTTEQRDAFLDTQTARKTLSPAWSAYLLAHRRWEQQVEAARADLERSAERE